MTKKKKTLWIVLAAVAAVVLVLIVLMAIGGKGKYVVNVNTATAEQGSVEHTITATGEIQPVYKVTVGTQVSGIVEKLYVDYNSTVKKGQLLAELDKSNLREQVKQCKASLSTAQSNKDLAQKSFDRVAKLYAGKAATQEEYDQAESSLQQAKNQLLSAKSNYESAVTNLGYATIYSPIDGVVLNKEVEEGQTVAASFSTPTMFTIAKNLTEMQVEANIDEADIGQVHEGQKVTFTVDAFPGEVFNGTVNQLRLNPTVTSNVVTYKVIIAANNDEGKLYPGMTASVSIAVNNEEGVTVPLEATYFELTADYVKMLAKEGYKLPMEAMKAMPSMKKGMMPGNAPEEKAAPKNGKTELMVVKDKEITLREVKTGMDDGANVIVKEGLELGEQVLLSVSKEKVGGREAKSMFQGPQRRKR
jgi:HlyD family secretion protein